MKTEKMIREILETLVKIDKLTRVQAGSLYAAGQQAAGQQFDSRGERKCLKRS